MSDDKPVESVANAPDGSVVRKAHERITAPLPPPGTPQIIGDKPDVRAGHPKLAAPAPPPPPPKKK